MPTTKRNDPAESLRLALVSFDAQIAELRETRAQLATLIDQPSSRLSRESGGAAKAEALSRGEGENQRHRKGALGQRELATLRWVCSI